MKVAALTHSELERLYQEHIRKEAAIWEELRDKLIDEYLRKGYYIQFARVKADNEVLELRSRSRNSYPMPPEEEFHYLEFEPLD